MDDRTPADSSSFRAIGLRNIAVVTCAASGIGFAAARAFATEGMRVCLVDRAGEPLNTAARPIPGAQTYAFDAADRAAVEDLPAQITGTHGPVSVLMKNAGVGSGGDALGQSQRTS